LGFTTAHGCLIYKKGQPLSGSTLIASWPGDFFIACRGQIIGGEKKMALKVMETPKSVAEIARVFPEVCARYKFGVLGTIDIRQKLQEKGLSFDRDCLIFEVCNPQAAQQVLQANPAISAVLPCRISVYQENGRTKIAAIRPTALLGLFPNPELQPVAEEVEATLVQIRQDLV
jgi:uncharacterized protein (DUF302 family)